jgi:hypothetical protein
MNPPQRDDPDSIHFRIAAQKVFTGLEWPASAGGPRDRALDLALDGREVPPSLGLSGGGPAPGREDQKRALSRDAAESPGAGF